MTDAITVPPGFDWIRVENLGLFAAAVHSARVAALIRHVGITGSPQGRRMQHHAFATASGLLAISGAKCPFGQPPADIELDFDPGTKGMYLKCSHHPRHKWRLNGTPLES